MSQAPDSLLMPGQLLNKLQQVPEFGVTIITGPAGYGKTTVIRRLVAIHREAVALWCPTHWENREHGWRGCCDTVSLIDPEAGAALNEIDLFNGGDVQAARVLRKMTSKNGQSVFLILDDVHRLFGVVPPILLPALLEHTCPSLRIILAGSGLTLQNITRFNTRAAHWISQEDLTYTTEDIEAHLTRMGVDDAPDRAQEIYRTTYGWPAGVAQCLQDPPCVGETSAPHLDALIGKLMFDRLPPAQQERLLALSYCDAFGEADICSLWGTDSLSREDALLVAQLPLLNADTGTGLWQATPPLQAFLRTRLQHTPAQMYHRVNMAVGNWLAQRGDTAGAIGRYYAVGDYEAIMRLDLKLLSYTDIDGKPFAAIARELVQQVPMRVKQAYPISLLRLAYHLFGAGDMGGYDLAMAQAQTFMTPEKDPALYGEWLLMHMLKCQPDIEKMHAILLEALKYLTVPARAIPRDEPFLFGSPTLGFVFYDVPGEGDAVAVRMAHWLKDFRRVHGGMYGGAPDLYRAELQLMRMNLDEALTLAYTALPLAEREQQLGILYGVTLLLARVAVYRREPEGVQAALDMMDRYREQFTPAGGKAMWAFIHASVRNLALTIAEVDGVQVEGAGEGGPLPSGETAIAQLALYARMTNKLQHGDVLRAIGEMEAVLSNRSGCSTFTLLRVYGALGVAWSMAGSRERSVSFFMRALELAQPDRLLAPLIDYDDSFRILINDPQMRPWVPFMQEVMVRAAKLREESRGGKAAPHHNRYYLLLTEREMEVARLAARGLSNAEIAQKLCVSENTIKKHMQRVFRKLNIDRRSQLMGLFSEH